MIGPVVQALLEHWFGRLTCDRLGVPLILAGVAVSFLAGGPAQWRRSRPQAIVLLAVASLPTLGVARLIASAVTDHDPSPTFPTSYRVGSTEPA